MSLLDDREEFEWPESGFPGIKVDPHTRRYREMNPELVDATLAERPRVASQVFVLMVRGKTTEAAELLAEARMSDPESFRLLLLDTEILYQNRRFDAAVQRLGRMLSTYADTEYEAEVHQHLGNALFARGEFTRSAESFSRALSLRVANHAPTELIYSSTVALQEARHRAEAPE